MHFERRLRATWRWLLLILAVFLLPQAQAQHYAGLRQDIATSLVKVDDGRFLPYQWQKAPKILALYFGADWCVYCHAFMPQLRQAYAQLRQRGVDTELVYVSQDRSEREMLRYMQRQGMTWPAVDFRRLRGLPLLGQLAGLAPPNLVLLDQQGNLLASGWDQRRYLGPSVVLDVWMR